LNGRFLILMIQPGPRQRLLDFPGPFYLKIAISSQLLGWTAPWRQSICTGRVRPGHHASCPLGKKGCGESPSWLKAAGSGQVFAKAPLMHGGFRKVPPSVIGIKGDFDVRSKCLRESRFVPLAQWLHAGWFCLDPVDHPIGDGKGGHRGFLIRGMPVDGRADLHDFRRDSDKKPS